MRKIVAALFFVCFAPAVFAVPGLDTLQALKQYAVLLKQLKELKKQVSQAKEMINQGKQAIKDAEGHYGFGKLLESEGDFQKREWGGDTWDDALKKLSGGNSERYQELLKQYEKNHPSLSDHQFSKGASQSLTHSYRNRVDNNRVATASADLEYEKIKSYQHNVHQLSQQIESAPNTKAALDLNSRLIAELSYVSVEELRMQTLANHQLAAEASDDIEARQREAMFNRLPEEK